MEKRNQKLMKKIMKNDTDNTDTNKGKQLYDQIYIRFRKFE